MNKKIPERINLEDLKKPDLQKSEINNLTIKTKNLNQLLNIIVLE